MYFIPAVYDKELKMEFLFFWTGITYDFFKANSEKELIKSRCIIVFPEFIELECPNKRVLPILGKINLSKIIESLSLAFLFIEAYIITALFLNSTSLA